MLYIYIYIIELDDGKIYRKALYLMVKTMVSCKFSLKPIQWIYIYIYDLPVAGPATSWPGLEHVPRPWERQAKNLELSEGIIQVVMFLGGNMWKNLGNNLTHMKPYGKHIGNTGWCFVTFWRFRWFFGAFSVVFRCKALAFLDFGESIGEKRQECNFENAPMWRPSY